MVEEENPLIPVDRDICGAIKRFGRFEFICINPPHDKIYKRAKGGYTPSYNKGPKMHYMVNRWPNRPV